MKKILSILVLISGLSVIAQEAPQTKKECKVKPKCLEQCQACFSQCPAPCTVECQSWCVVEECPTPPLVKCQTQCKKPCKAKSQTQCQKNINLPYGNLGLNYLSKEISKSKEALKEASSVELFFDYAAVYVGNVSGGIETGSNYTAIMEFGAIVDLEKSLGWKGAKFNISGAYNTGDDLNSKVGSIFTIAETSVAGGAFLYNLYLQQEIELNDTDNLQILLGRMSMANVFNTLPIFNNLAGGGVDSTPESIFSNSPFTSTSIATWSGVITYNTVENLSFSAGLFQLPDNILTDAYHGTNMTINSSDGYMALVQVQWAPTLFKCNDSCGLKGLYQAGAWVYDNFVGTSLSGGDNNYGFYAQAQQEVWVDAKQPHKKIIVWLGTQIAPNENESTLPYMLYAGTQFKGFVPYRSQDSILISWTTSFVNSQYTGSSVAYDGNPTTENILELTYIININKNIAIQPDFQYIIDPSGNSNIDNAIVLGMQLLISF